MNRKISEFHLEQYLLGEAPDWVADAIESDPDAQARVRELEDDNRAFFEKYPPEQMMDRIRQDALRQEQEEERESLPEWAKASRQEERGGARDTFGGVVRDFVATLTMRPALSLGAAAALVVLLALPFFIGQAPDLEFGGSRDEYVRLKGLEPNLTIYARDPYGEIVELESGATVAAGDTLQIAYNAAGAGHGMIFSIDGRGMVTLHFPANPFESDSLTTGGEIALPYSYVLDDSPEFERFFFVAATAEVDVAGVITTLEEMNEPGAVDAAEVATIAAEESNLDAEEIGVESVTLRK